MHTTNTRWSVSQEIMNKWTFWEMQRTRKRISKKKKNEDCGEKPHTIVGVGERKEKREKGTQMTTETTQKNERI